MSALAMGKRAEPLPEKSDIFEPGIYKPDTYEADTYELEEVVVTATRMETSIQDVAANITVITKSDIEKMPVASVADILKNIPGVYAEFNGGLGSNATIRIQGSEIRHVAVYQDGVPLNQLANPLTDLSYIPVESIDRVEVYKGAASSVWGSSLGGVVNIITQRPDKEKVFAADIKSSYGEFGTVKNRGTFSGTIDRFSYLFSYTGEKSAGFINFTEYDQEAVYAKAGYNIDDKSRITFTLSYDEGRAEDPMLSKPDYWNDNNQRRRYQKLAFETSINENIFLTIEGRHHSFDALVNRNFSDHRELFNDYKDEILGGSARIIYRIRDLNTINIGFDGDWGEYDWINYARKYKTGNWAVYANDTYTMGDFTLNIGIRNDDNKDFGSAISPSGGMVYHFPGHDALVRFQVARGFSAPPPSQIHDPVYGNKDLKPEIAVNYQAGTELNLLKFLKFEINLFRSNVKDLIQYRVISADNVKPLNIGKATRTGVEGALSARFDFGLDLSFGYSFTKVRDEEINEQIMDIPETMYKVSSIYSYKWMTHSLMGNYMDYNSSYPETRDKVFVFDYLVNIRLPLPEKYGKTTLFGAGYNIFNTRSIYRYVWPKPGRWIEAGVRFEF